MSAGHAAWLIEEARRYADLPELQRGTLVTQLIFKGRMLYGYGDAADDEIFRAAGYRRGAPDYWLCQLSEPVMPASALVHLLDVHTMDPSEPRNEFDRRSIKSRIYERALRLGIEAREPWLISGDASDLDEARVRPLAAVQWLLNNPKYRDQLPRSLREAMGPAPQSDQSAVDVSEPRDKKRGTYVPWVKAHISSKLSTATARLNASDWAKTVENAIATIPAGTGRPKLPKKRDALITQIEKILRELEPQLLELRAATNSKQRPVTTNKSK